VSILREIKMYRNMVVIKNKPISSCPVCGSRIKMDPKLPYIVDQFFDCKACKAHLVVSDYKVREEVGV